MTRRTTRARVSRSFRPSKPALLCALGLLLASTLAGAPALAKGKFHTAAGADQGDIDFSVYFRFPPTPGQVQELKQTIIDGSKILCEATEGQVRLGEVKLLGGEGKTALKNDADVWVFPFTESGRSSVNCSPIEDANCRMSLLYDPPLQSSDLAWAHEFGHLVFGLGDEYDEQSVKLGNCVQKHEAGWAESGQHNCLMQSLFYDNGVYEGVDFGADEFCTAKWHDKVKLDDSEWFTCPDSGDVISGCERNDGVAQNDECESRCCLFNYGTCRYEGTRQTQRFFDSNDGSIESCWDTMVQKFPFLSGDGPDPGGLPDFSSPTCDPPTFDESGLETADKVELVLDKSGSMRFDPEKGKNCDPDCPEICDNDLDDDGDLVEDEADCNQSAMAFLKGSANAFLTLLSATPDTEAGIVSFASTAKVKEDIQPVAGNLDTLQTTVKNLKAGGDTNIGAGLELGGMELLAEAEGTKAVLLITDGKHNVAVEDGGIEPDQAVADLIGADIPVFWISVGNEAGSDDVLGQFIPQSGGGHIHSEDARELATAFTQQWGRYIDALFLIHKLPYKLASTTFEPPGNIRDAGDWMSFDGTPLPEPGLLNNRFQVPVPEGTERLTVVLAGTMANMKGFGVGAVLDGPLGPNPNHFETQAPGPDPYMNVVNGAFAKLIQILDPNPGDWIIDVQLLLEPGIDPEQDGNITVIAEHPRLDLITALDRHVVDDTLIPVELRISPMLRATLQNLDALEVSVRRPDDSVVAVPVQDLFDDRGHYVASIAGMPFQGLYEARVRVRSVATTTIEPGESLFFNAPPNDVFPVPVFETTAVEYFYVQDPTSVKFCPGAAVGDCDLDGIPDTLDSLSVDTDGDGLVDGCDPDSDQDEIPDGVDPSTDNDSDSLPDFLDPDSDDDGVADGKDAGISTRGPVHMLQLADGEVGTWGNTVPSPVHASSDEPITGMTVGIEWVPSTALEIVSIGPGDELGAGDIASFSTTIETGDLGPGQALAELALNAGVSLGPDQAMPVLELSLRARPVALPGQQVSVCFGDGLGLPAQDTTLDVDQGGSIQTVVPQKFCSTVTIVADTTPPVILCPADLTLPADGSCSATWSEGAMAWDNTGATPAVVSTPPIPAVFSGEGSFPIIYTATDAAGNSTSCTSTVSVVDDSAPALSVGLSPDVLTPPDHLMVTITPAVSSVDNCSTAPITALVSATSSEADNAPGPVDGDTDNDIQDVDLGTLDLRFSLRAERADTGPGRIYTIIYESTDAAGNMSSSPEYVFVPPGATGGSPDTIVLSVNETVSGTLVEWSAAGPTSYDVIRGQLGSLSDTGVLIDLGPVVCIEDNSVDLDTVGFQDLIDPGLGEAFFYLVQFDDGVTSTYGASSDGKPRAPGAGGCP